MPTRRGMFAALTLLLCLNLFSIAADKAPLKNVMPGGQAAAVEAIFVYNTAMRDQMLPRKPLPHPELEEQRKAPLKNVMPGAEAPEEEAKKPGN